MKLTEEERKFLWVIRNTPEERLEEIFAEVGLLEEYKEIKKDWRQKTGFSRSFFFGVPFCVPFWEIAIFDDFSIFAEKYQKAKEKSGKRIVSTLESWSW